MPYRILCNGVQREGAKLSLSLASELFCYVPLHKIRYGVNIKWLVSGDIHKEEIYDCEGRITELALKQSNARLLPVNSVLIALNGQGKTRGTVAILRTEATCNQSLVSINPAREKLTSEFLLYVLKSKYQEIRDITGDEQRSGLNMPIIRSIEIPLPHLEVQRQIVTEIKEEQKRVQATKELADIFEQKIKDKIAKVWGEMEASEAEVKAPPQFGTFKQVKRVQEPEVEQAELGLS